MIIFPCHACKTRLSAEPSQAGQLVRCPTCLSTLRVPASAPAGSDAATNVTAGAVAGPGRSAAAFAPRGGGKRYGFNCGYCSSRLEANEGMAAQEGQCPTCGNTIIIPLLDRYGRLIDPMTGKIIKQDPHPVHAYAAAGDRAPGIVRGPDGRHQIKCPRCAALSPIVANNCKACGMPFTMEGTTLEASGASNGFCVASLVLGIIGIPASCTVITPLLAIVFGIVGLAQLSQSGTEAGGRGMAIAGLICGGIGVVCSLMLYLG